MKTVRLRTPFEVGSTPLAEYPRPQFARNSYVTLNGEWDYAILRKSEGFDGKYQGKILVPFSPECFARASAAGLINDLRYELEETLRHNFFFFFH